MSFLDNIKAKTATGNNPFSTNVGGAKVSTSKTGTNPFALKATAPSAPKPGVPTAPTMPKAGAPIPPSMPKPGVPAPIPSSVPKNTVESPVVPTPVQATNEEPKKVSTEELVKDVKNIVVEDPKENNNETEVKAETEVVAEEKAKEKVETKTKATKSRSKSTSAKKKSTTSSKTKESTDKVAQEEVETVNTIFKIPTTTMKYSDAIKAIGNGFVDEEWENFRASMIKEADGIPIESDMQEGAIKKTLEKLNTLRDKVWLHFCDTKVQLENISSKDTEGLIETIKLSNYEGSNDTSRKKAAVLAVMNYKTPEGETINLYEVYYETRARLTFLKCLMDTIEYKNKVLITMSGALKMQKGA